MVASTYSGKAGSRGTLLVALGEEGIGKGKTNFRNWSRLFTPTQVVVSIYAAACSVRKLKADGRDEQYLKVAKSAG
jgi:hypothetical protein